MATDIRESEKNGLTVPEMDVKRDTRELDTTDDSANWQDASEHDDATDKNIGMDCSKHNATDDSGNGVDISEHDASSGGGNGVDISEHDASNGGGNGVDISEHDASNDKSNRVGSREQNASSGRGNGVDISKDDTSSGVGNGVDISEHDASNGGGNGVDIRENASSGRGNGLDIGKHNASNFRGNGVHISEHNGSNSGGNGIDISKHDISDADAHGRDSGKDNGTDDLDNGKDNRENRDGSDGFQVQCGETSAPDPATDEAARPPSERRQENEENNCCDTPPGAMERADQGQTHCPKCREFFRNPKILPCAHVLCRSCVVSVLEEIRTAGCPLCGCCIANSSDDNDCKTAADIADALKVDKSIEVLVDCATLLQQQFQCCVCETRGALHVCLDCGDMMCGTCVKAHQKFSRTKDHKVEELSSLTPSGLAARRRPNVLEMYCGDHHLALSPQAVVFEHRKCSEVNTVDEETKTVDEVLIQLAAQLSASESEVQAALAKLELYQYEEKVKISDSLAYGDGVCDHLEKAIADCRHRFKNQARKAEYNLNKQVSSRRKDLMRLENRLASHQELTQRVLGIGPCTEKIYMKEVVQTKVRNSLDSCRPPPELPPNSPPITAVPSPLVGLIRAAIANLGQVASTQELCEISQPFQDGIDYIRHTRAEHEDGKSLLQWPWESWLRGRSATEASSPPSDSRAENDVDPHRPIVPGCQAGADSPSVSPPSAGSSVVPWQSPSTPCESDVRHLISEHEFQGDYTQEPMDAEDSLSFLFDLPPFAFHRNVGTNIVLYDRDTKVRAREAGAVGDGIILSCQPMNIGHLYEVQVSQVFSTVGSEMSVGVCFREDLSSLTLPTSVKNMHRNAAVVISPRLAEINGEMSPTDPRRRLKDISAGRRIGVLVDSKHRLHLYVNRKDCGALASISQPFFYAMFELYCGIEEVHALPVLHDP